MNIFELATFLEFPDDRVWVAGDWHGNEAWASLALRSMGQHDGTVKTLLHLGDFVPHQAFLEAIDHEAELAGIERVMFIPGNHEPWPQLIQIEEDLAPGCAARISETVWFLPRPYRFTLGGRRVLALGGAASVDAGNRTHGIDWWPEELITEKLEALAIVGGPADVLLTHESPVSAVPEVQLILETNPLGFPPPALKASAAQRERVERVWTAVGAQVLLHGHMHTYGSRTFADGRRIFSLGCDYQPGNVGLFDLSTLELTPLTIPFPEAPSAAK